MAAWLGPGGPADWWPDYEAGANGCWCMICRRPKRRDPGQNSGEPLTYARFQHVLDDSRYPHRIDGDDAARQFKAVEAGSRSVGSAQGRQDSGETLADRCEASGLKGRSSFDSCIHGIPAALCNECDDVRDAVRAAYAKLRAVDVNGPLYESPPGLGVEPWRVPMPGDAVDVQQTSEGAARTGVAPGSDRQTPATIPAGGGSEEPAPTSGEAKPRHTCNAAVGSLKCVACAMGLPPEKTGLEELCERLKAEGAGSPGEPPFSSVSRPGPQRPLAGEYFDRERWDAQLLGACREALAAIHGGRLPEVP